MKLSQKLRPVIASIIVISWLVVELVYGAINHPTLELRIMLFTALIWLFGESVQDAVDLIRNDESG